MKLLLSAGEASGEMYGAALIEAQFPAPDSGGPGRDWPGWLIAHLLLDEARTLLPAGPSKK